MSAESLLERLQGVRKTGAGRWMARCPAHEDRGPSLSVRDKDGVVLIHCFRGCSAPEVAQAAGIELSSLFPPSDGKTRAKMSQEKRMREALQVFRGELNLVFLTLNDVLKGKRIDPERVKKAKETCLKILEEVQ